MENRGPKMKSFLQVFQSQKMAALLFVGFSSGLPILLVFKTLQSWMSDAGTDLTKIGWYGSLIGFPYAFKYLWSPLLDRYSPPFMGQRKGWLIVIQLLLVLSIGTMALQDPTKNLELLAFNSVLIAFLGASQDIVADAYRTDVLAEPEAPVGMGIFTAGYRVALIVAFAGASKLFGNVFHAWQPVYLAMAGLMLLCLVFTLMAPETEIAPDRAIAPETEIAPDPETEDFKPKTLADAIILPFADFFQRRGQAYSGLVLLFIVAYKVSDAMMNAMSIPFLKAACFSTEQIGDINGFMGIVAAIVGALLGGVLLNRLNVFAGLWIFGSLQAIGIVFYLMLAQNIHPDPNITDLAKVCQNFIQPAFSYELFVLAIIVENFCGGMEAAAFALFLTGMCYRKFTATQYALLSSLMALSKLIVAPIGEVVKSVGWSNFFWLSMVTIVPSLVLLIAIARLDRALILKARKSVINELTERLGELPPATTQDVCKLNLRGLEYLSKELFALKSSDRLNGWLNDWLRPNTGSSKA
jgi:MFS transporter, PAT family, beta-lactamase induction signal transducer AmpG